MRALTIHADYACRQSGRCCTAGWAIPVEAPLYRELSDALADGRLQQPSDTEMAAPFLVHAPRPADAAALLAVRPSGACVFFDGAPSNLCALQRQGGVAWLPSACRHFPRVALRDARGTSITLSHYCPTAARQLLRTDVPLAITDRPPAFPSDSLYEGLDARDTWPPLLRPGVLANPEMYDLWEAHLVGACADEDLCPEDALYRIVRVTEALRTWTVDDGPLVERARAICASPPSALPAEAAAFAAGHRDASWPLHALVSAAIPAALASSPDAPWNPLVWRDQVEPAWRALARPIRRYLAARGFANWLAYQGQGLRTVVAGLAAALGVLRVEAVRLAARHVRPLDEALLLDAFQESDRRLVHLASPDDLARRLAAAEASATGAWLRALGDGTGD